MNWDFTSEEGLPPYTPDSDAITSREYERLRLLEGVRTGRIVRNPEGLWEVPGFGWGCGVLPESEQWICDDFTSDQIAQEVAV